MGPYLDADGLQGEKLIVHGLEQGHAGCQITVDFSLKRGGLQALPSNVHTGKASTNAKRLRVEGVLHTNFQVLVPLRDRRKQFCRDSMSVPVRELHHHKSFDRLIRRDDVHPAKIPNRSAASYSAAGQRTPEEGAANPETPQPRFCSRLPATKLRATHCLHVFNRPYPSCVDIDIKLHTSFISSIISSSGKG